MNDTCFSKRVCLVSTARHLDLTTGIGNYMLGMFELFPNVLFDIVTDNQLEAKERMRKTFNSNIIDFGSKKSSLNPFWTAPFSHNIHLEETYLISECLVEHCRRFIYDIIITNDYESLSAVLLSGLCNIMPVCYVTHIPIKSKMYSKMFGDLEDSFLSLEKVIAITQLESNKANYRSHNLRVAPLPITDKRFLVSYKGKREGLLFVGNFEKRKEPGKFFDFIKQYPDFKIKILTNKSSEEKWIKCLKGFKRSCFEIETNLSGEEKVHFIQSSELAYHPSSEESFGLAALESLYSCPTILSDSPWADYFLRFPYSMRLSDFSKEKIEGFDHQKQIDEMILRHYNPTFDIWNSLLFTRHFDTDSNIDTGFLKKVSNTYQDIKSIVRTFLVDYQVEQIQRYFPNLEFCHTHLSSSLRQRNL